MPFLFLLLFIAVPLAEIAILVKVGQYIGVLWTVVIVVFTALIGTTLLRFQGFGVLARVGDAISAGRMPVEPAIEGLCLLVAGAFLLTPGLLTDAVGFLLLVPFIRISLAKWTLHRLLESGSVRVSVFKSGGRRRDRPSEAREETFEQPPGGPVIDGEFERIDEHTKRPRRRDGNGKSGS